MTHNHPDSAPAKALTLPIVVKWLLAAVLTVICTAGGVYIGFTAGLSGLGNPDIPRFENRSILTQGKTFPDYDLWDTEAEVGTTVAAVAAEGPAMLVFMSRNCSVCMSMANYWNSKVVPEMTADVRIICVFDDDDWYGSENPDSLFRIDGAHVYTTDRAKQIDEDGITGTPAIIALNTDRTIELVVSGFDRRLRADVIEKLF